MKRFYLPVGVATVVAALTLSIGATNAEGWHKLDGKVREASAPAHRQLTPKERRLEKLGANLPGQKIQSVYDGLQHVTPAVDMAPANVIAKTIEAPRAHLYGVVSRTSSMQTAAQAYLASIDPLNLTITPRYYGSIYATSQGDSYVYQGAGYRDGKIYIPELTQGAEGIQIYWNEVDLATGVQTNRYYYGADLNADAYSICHDIDNDVFYTLSFTQDSDSHLGMVDPKDGFKYTYLGHLGAGEFYAGLAYNPMDKKIYAFDDDINVYTVNLRNISTLKAGELDLDYSMFTPTANAAVTYSPMDEAFICLFRDNYTESNRIVLIDPDSFEVTDAGPLKGRSDIFISSIICADDFADAEAPELPEAMTFSFDKNSLSGDIIMTVPSLTYYGVEIPATTPVKVTLKSGDKVIYSANHKPGEKVTARLTLDQAYHHLAYTCSIGDKESPARKQNLAVGNDNPAAPTNIKVEGNTISWTAPTSVGAHQGYVDTSALTYDVYFNKVKQNATPISGCSYTFNVAGDLALTAIDVIATANGVSSEPGSINFAIGNAMRLPFASMPSQEESELYTTLNNNNDVAYWFFTTQKETGATGMAMPMSYYNDSDDWLFLPAIHFDNSDTMYQISFDGASLYSTPTLQSVEIFIGKHPSVKGMTEKVYSDLNLTIDPSATPVLARFAVPAPGDYYIGIHDRSTKANSAKGMFVNNFLVQAIAGSSSAVPASPNDVVITPAPLGAKSATLSFTMPAKDLTGNTLDPSKELTAAVLCGTYVSRKSGLPGAPVSIDVRVPKSGVNLFSLAVSNDKGDGLNTNYSAYVGIDRPMAPQNIKGKVSEDNLSMELSWDAPGEIGLNGGYVDPSSLLYDIYMRNGVAYTRVGTTDKLNVSFEPSLHTQVAYHVGPVARNEGGISEYSEFVQEVLGTPYETPVIEEFNTVNFAVNPYSQMQQNEYAGSRWESVGTVANLGVGNAILIQGAVIAYSESGLEVPALLKFPKICTKGYDKLTFTMRYWDYVKAPAMQIRARTASNQSEFIVARVNPKHKLIGEWSDFTFTLPEELMDQGWVEFAVYANLRATANEYVILDSWQVMPDIEYDLKVKEITGPDQISIGNTAKFAITVVNAGQLRNQGKLKLELCTEGGQVIDSQSLSTAQLNHNQEYTASAEFEIGGAFADSKNLMLRATVTAPNDDLLANNTLEYKVPVKPSQLPVVKTIRQTSYDETTGDLQGRVITPSLTYGAIQDFELETPFLNTEHFNAGWQNIDMDKCSPGAIGSGNLEIKWDGYGQPCAWTVIDPVAMGFENDQRLFAHSGKQCIMARALYQPSEDKDLLLQSSDWLISPEVKGGSQVSFWFNTLASDYKEYIEIWYSTTGTNLSTKHPIPSGVNGDFIKLRSFSKEGSDVWDYVSFQLPDDAKYFAIVYTSIDELAAMLDDIEITPANLCRWELDHYELWRSIDRGKPECIDNNMTTSTFSDNLPADKRGEYWVYAVVKGDDGKLLRGPKSPVLVVNNHVGVQTITTLDGIRGGKEEIVVNGCQGQTLSIFALDGKLIKTARPASDAERIAIDKGIYIVRCNGATAKVVVM